MATGLPTVVTDVGGNRELVNNEENGYIVPENRPDLLSEKMQIIINDEKIRKEFGEKAKSIIRNKFSTTNMIHNYINLYRKMT